MTVDVEVPAGRYEVIAWLAEVPTLRERGMEPLVRPIAMGVYGDKLVAALDSVAPVDRSLGAFDEYRPWNSMMWGVLSHIEPAWGRAARFNYHDDNARGAADRAISWMLQAAVHGDAEALPEAIALLNATDPGSAAERDRLLGMRGQTLRTEGSSTDLTPDVAEAMSSDAAARELARRRIIDGVDITAMVSCAGIAEADGDMTDTEFWWLEVATAPPPAGDDAITRGVLGLCEHVLLPQGRLEEAEFYCRHLLTRPSEDSRRRGRAMIDRIEAERASRGGRRLVLSDAWRRVDLTQPSVPTADQQEHLLHLFAFLEARADQHNIRLMVSVSREEFLPSVTGWLIGFSGADGVEEIGLSRDTVAKALCDWLLAQGSPNVARDGGGPATLTKKSPGL